MSGRAGMLLKRLCWFATVFIAAVLSAAGARAADPPKVPRIAAIVTAYYHNSHADVLVSRLLQTDTLDGKGRRPALQLVALYTDQVPDNDISRKLSKEFGIPIYNTVAETLKCGTAELAVDGVLLIAEHGIYDESPTGQILFPKRRLFTEIVTVFEQSRRVVPIFSDKHLADNWDDAKWIYDTAARLKIPMMAGSSLPGLWRYPPVDVKRDAKLKEMVAVSYHRLDTYGFHALEAVQCLAERRAGGETGVKSVRCLEGDAVWEAGRAGVYDRKLLDEALARLKEQPLRKDLPLEKLVPEPVLFVIDYNDGLRASVLTLNGAVAEWTAAWRYDDGKTESTLFWTQEARPFHHFAFLLDGIEKMMHTGQPAWPVERTLMTSGVLDKLLVSKLKGNVSLTTGELSTIGYKSNWSWKQPPPPPEGRPIQGQ